jgi:pimeloyl-ACP methyl ester carboxylesterase
VKRMMICWVVAMTGLVACATGIGGGSDVTPDVPAVAASTPAPSVDASASPSPETATAATGEAIQGTFDVGGHSLFMRCEGSRSPTIVYIHGYIHSSSEGGGSNAGTIPGLLRDDYRVCIYDGANVGQSDPVNGRQTGADSVRDLHALLRAADVPGPYLLLAASFGGLIAYRYAVVHPEDVVGMVLLDANLPGDVAVDEEFGGEPPPDDWKQTLEHIDIPATYDEALQLPTRSLDMVVTYIASTEVPPVPEYIKGLRDMQNDFLERFTEGHFVQAAAPHFMEPAIPEQIAEEVRAVAELA